MSMGERIRQARMEAGLSQRQLAGDAMTRNMLSALEHDGANPSVATLKYLSVKLCKPICYFLGEDLAPVPEAGEMEQARALFGSGEYALCIRLLNTLNSDVFQTERVLLQALCLLEMTEKAIDDGKKPYAMDLLHQSEQLIEESVYQRRELKRRWLILSAKAADGKARSSMIQKIPAEDDILLLRAQGAVENGQYEKGARLLEAVEDRKGTLWNMLRGEIYLAQQEYTKAAQCFHNVEQEKQYEVDEKLEICYRELGNYKMAYFYAKKAKMGK